MDNSTTAVADAKELARFAELLDEVGERKVIERGLRERAQTLLTEAQSQLQAITDYSPAAVNVRDIQGRYVLVNRRQAQLMERTAGEIIGRTPFDVFSHEVATGQRTRELTIIRSRAPAEWEELVHLPSGMRMFAVHGFPLLGLDGNVQYVGYVSTELAGDPSVDVVRKQKLPSLQDSLTRFVALFRASPVPVIIIDDRSEEIIDVNEAFELLTSYERDDAVARTVAALALVSDDAHELLRNSLLRDGRVAQFETPIRTKSGDWLDCLISEEFVDTHEGRLRILGLVDITARKRSETSLILALATADRARQARSEFVSRISHELRTPLNVILGFAQVLQLGPLSDDQKESVAIILDAGRHLLNLVDDVLDITMLDSNRVRLSIEPVSLEVVVMEAIDLIQPLATEMKVSVRLAYPADGRIPSVMADHHRLKQVVLNLLSNGVKYNYPDGSVQVECTDAAGDVRISVIDTGKGIPRSRLDVLFEPFERVGAEGTVVEGRGLGLAVSKRFVEAMGGAIGAEPNAGAGTTFSVRLPRAAPVSHGPDTGNLSSANGCLIARSVRVLYIEHDLTDIELIERVLSRFDGMEVVPAALGSLALQLAAQQPPNVVVLDLRIPDMTGDEFVRRLRGNPDTATVPVVVLGFDSTRNDIQRLEALGLVTYLPKPLDIRDFTGAVARALANDGREAAPPPSVPPNNRPRRRRQPSQTNASNS